MPRLKLGLVRRTHHRQMLTQGLLQAAWQHGPPILHALAVAHQNLATRKVHILDLQPHHFHQAHAGSVQQAAGQPKLPVQAGKHAPHFLDGKHHWQAFGPFRPYHVIEPGKLDSQYLLVEKQQCCQRLILRGGRYLAPHRQIGQEDFHLRSAHFRRVSIAVKPYELLHPVAIDLLGTDGVVFDANPVAHLIEQPGLAVHGV